MAIIFNEEKKMFHLQTKKTSYVMWLVDDYVLLHLYYGERLESLAGLEDTVNIFEESGFSANDYNLEKKDNLMSTDVLPMEYSFFGSTDLRKPAFHAQYENGSRITKMKYLSHTITASKPKLKGLPATYTENDKEADTLEIKMHDELTGLTLIYRYTAFNEYDAITRSVTAVNEGTQKINIKSIMSLSMDFYDNEFEFIHLWGGWGRERYLERTPLIRGNMNIESRRGSSSHHHSPFFALARKNASEEQGEVYGFSLLYSGNFEAGAETYNREHTRVYMGINSFDFNWLLEEREEFNAPEVVMVYSANGIGEMSRTYHKLYRERLARGKFRDKERPILINNWEATYFDFDEEKILNIAKTAKIAGIELMVLDDGWFGKRDSDNCSLGDWYENKRKLPNGIKGLAEKINALGMQFGLWFEPEMISVNSDLYRAHPDWCLHVEGRGRSESRRQLILDLSRDDVCEYIINILCTYLENAPIAYIKWDMNRNMTEVGSAKLSPDRQQEIYHRYMLGLYNILETVTQKFPDVLFEGCSGGGGRFDAGMMHYFNQYWTSDDTDAVERLYIQHGTSMVMPPVFMGAHVSAVPNHQTGRTTSLKMRGDVAMCGQFGYELDVTKMTDEEIEEIAKQIKYYKSVREIIHKGDMYRLKSPFECNCTAWEFISEDENTVLFSCFTAQAKLYLTENRIRLSGLEQTADYKRREDGKIFNGGVLMNNGILIGELRDFESKVMVFDKIIN